MVVLIAYRSTYFVVSPSDYWERYLESTWSLHRVYWKCLGYLSLRIVVYQTFKLDKANTRIQRYIIPAVQVLAGKGVRLVGLGEAEEPQELRRSERKESAGLVH